MAYRSNRLWSYASRSSVARETDAPGLTKRSNHKICSFALVPTPARKIHCFDCQSTNTHGFSAPIHHEFTATLCTVVSIRAYPGYGFFPLSAQPLTQHNDLISCRIDLIRIKTDDFPEFHPRHFLIRHFNRYEFDLIFGPSILQREFVQLSD
jgi:hypothetical protein